ncbi:sirohydrochlorin chelatase [uncultured Pseudokineococcus sp.]|uniref:sirohydrochlorin chelatase n=1 Tax=uncultured Pseudokineococcus sp. TaxID=1642928 RepID=UPI002627252F|nr:CbiX/SirB N-terminal domain-containing protein [uncultured Pseudokineococcus sp.]
MDEQSATPPPPSTPSPGGSAPLLVLCAHGTRGPRGRRTVGALVDALSRARPGTAVRAAFVDVQPPTVADVVAQHAPERGVVVVPVLLSAGHHVGSDVARAVAPWSRAVSAGPLGPHPLLDEVLADRLAEAGALPGDAVVLAAAGSSDPRAAPDVERVAAALRTRHDGEVVVGYGAAAQPRVPDAVAALRERGARRVLVASYLLGPGFFHDRLAGVGADAVSEPLLTAPDGALEPRVLAAVWSRFDAAAALPV